jgi:acetyl esterase/lipase
VHADAPPFFILHGDCDTLAPVDDARIFTEQLRSKSKQPVLYAELPGAQHAFDISTVRARRRPSIP